MIYSILTRNAPDGSDERLKIEAVLGDEAAEATLNERRRASIGALGGAVG